MGIPVWSVGQVLSASDVNTWFVPQAVYKPGDEPITTTVLQNDNDLQAAVASDAEYLFEILLHVTGAALTAGDIKIAMTWPSGASGMWMADGYLVNGTVTATIIHVETTSGTSHNLGVDASNGTPVRISGSVKTASTSGSLILQWAEVTGNASIPTEVKTGSKMTVQRVG